MLCDVYVARGRLISGVAGVRKDGEGGLGLIQRVLDEGESVQRIACYGVGSRDGEASVELREKLAVGIEQGERFWLT